MRCPICDKGSLKKKKVVVEKYGTVIGVFSADACSSCGEQIFDSKTAERIEDKIKKLGLWGLPVQSRIYKVGGNFVVSIKKKVAQALGINKPTEVLLIPQPKHKRFVVEVQ